MAEQLNMMLQGGGMKDSGVEQDPVSGNDIPPGSTASEVRDDVEARLSEGEYVLPADVVQFLGLDKIEKLVQKAKESLGEMESNGRIGGEVETEDDLPFSDEELQTMDEDNAVLKMAEGGLVGPTFNPADWGGGPNLPYETRTYVTPDGRRISVQFTNGQPASPIPEGAVPEVTYKSQQQGQDLTATKDLQVSQPPNSSGDEVEDPNDKGADFGSYTDEELSGYVADAGKGLGIAQTLAGTLAGPVGQLLGRGVTGLVNATNEKAVAELQARLARDDLDAETRKSFESALASFEDRKENQGGGGGLIGSLFSGGDDADTGGLLGGFFGKNDSLGRGTGIFDGDGWLTDALGTSKAKAPSTSTSNSRSTSTSNSSGEGGRTSTRSTSSNSQTSSAQAARSEATRQAADAARSRAGTQEAPENDYDRSGAFNKGGYVKKVSTYKNGGLVKRRK